MPALDPDGQVSLMLRESILHLLVEEGVIPRMMAIEAIDGVAELVREMEETKRPATRTSALGLIEAIAQTFALKD